MLDLSGFAVWNGKAGDAAVVDGIKNFPMIVRKNDLAPRWPEIVRCMGTVAFADMKRIDFRVDRQRGAGGWA